MKNKYCLRVDRIRGIHILSTLRWLYLYVYSRGTHIQFQFRVHGQYKVDTLAFSSLCVHRHAHVYLRA